MGIASGLELICVLETFLLYVYAAKYAQFDQGTIQTLIYLNLAIGGMLTIYATRVEGAFYSLKPGTQLMMATAGAALISTVMALGGIFIPKVSPNLVLGNCGYAIAWFLVID